jgi:hypothetical protein
MSETFQNEAKDIPGKRDVIASRTRHMRAAASSTGSDGDSPGDGVQAVDTNSRARLLVLLKATLTRFEQIHRHEGEGKVFEERITTPRVHAQAALGDGDGLIIARCATNTKMTMLPLLKPTRYVTLSWFPLPRPQPPYVLFLSTPSALIANKIAFGFDRSSLTALDDEL